MKVVKYHQFQCHIAEAVEEARIDMFTDLVNQITAQGVISAEWKLRSAVNCYKEKANVLERKK